jgi:hypothetical protein
VVFTAGDPFFLARRVHLTILAARHTLIHCAPTIDIDPRDLVGSFERTPSP